MSIKAGTPVMAPDGIAVILSLESEVAGARCWWVHLVSGKSIGVKRFYDEKNLIELVPRVSRPGYAGVTVWIGGQECTQSVDQVALESSRVPELRRRFESALRLVRQAGEKVRPWCPRCQGLGHYYVSKPIDAALGFRGPCRAVEVACQLCSEGDE